MPALGIRITAPSTVPSVVLDGGAGVVATITEDGLTDLSLNATTVLSGTLSAESSGSRFGIDDPSFGTRLSASVRQLSATSALVRHSYASAFATFTYAVDDEDLTITATVTNQAGATITVLGFEGLVGQWITAEDADVIMGYRTTSGTGLDAFHPGYFTPIGAWCQTVTIDATAIGFALYPINVGLHRTLCWDRVGPASVPCPSFYVSPCVGSQPLGVPSGQTYSVSFGLRLSLTTDWRHLLAPYRTQFRATFGAVQYTADDRPVASHNFDGTVDPVTNPYGLAERIDTDAGATAWIDTWLPVMTDSGCLGNIFWNPYGTDPRFLEFSPDVHLVPPEVATRLPSIVTALTTAGFRVGRLGQPHWIGSHSQWTPTGTPGYQNGMRAFTDQFLTLNADSAEQVQRTLDNFASAAPGSGSDDPDRGYVSGFDVFYLDSFPNTLNDLLILKALRAQWGSSVLAYTEQFSDVSMVYAGVYTELNGTSADSGTWAIRPTPGVGAPSTALMLQICRWLTAATSVICHDRTDPGATYDDTYFDWLYSRQLSAKPLTYRLETDVKTKILAHNATYLDGSNQWIYDWEASP